MKKWISAVLALAMLCSMVFGAAAADDTATRENPAITPLNREEYAPVQGFLSAEFLEENDYRYGDHETVRAIVVLQGDAEIDVAGPARRGNALRRRQIVEQQAQVQEKMAQTDYVLCHEFSALLNGFSCDVAYGRLEQIAAIDGVEAVYIANEYSIPEGEVPQTVASSEFTGNELAACDYGYGGQGTLVAVLDTGFTTDHEVFTNYFGSSSFYGYAGYSSSSVSLMTKTQASSAGTVKSGKYVSAKIPFAYDYADNDNNVADPDGHGTHVAGTAVGLVMDLSDGAVTFRGAAPYAQLLAMKIFSDTSTTTSSDIYLAALEDAYRLGADVINMSIGSPCGYTYDSVLEGTYGNIFSKLEKAGIVVCASAGNSYSMAEYVNDPEGVSSAYCDYGVVGSPGSYLGNVSVASMENNRYFSNYISIDGKNFAYMDSAKESADRWMTNFGGKTTNYVLVQDSQGELLYGYSEDYSGLSLSGKIAVVSRGSSSFQEKVDAAANAGAAGLIVVNNTEGTISMSIETFEIPAISVDLATRDTLLNAAQKKVYTSLDTAYVENSVGGQMSSFSSWGTSPDLTITPSVSSVGGQICSADYSSTTGYAVMSGTSMAAPNAAGTFANVLSYLNSRSSASKAALAQTARDLLLSTADVVIDPDGYAYSVRKQGSGVANSAKAMEAYGNSAYVAQPLAELGDDPTYSGSYSFTMELVNPGSSTVTMGDFYTLVMFDQTYVEGQQDSYYTSLSSDCRDTKDTDCVSIRYLQNGAEINSVTLAAGQTAEITVSIELTGEFKAYLQERFPNGSFIEGYSYAANLAEGKQSHSGNFAAQRFLAYKNAYDNVTHSTYLAFFGDWTKGSTVVDLSDFRDLMEGMYYAETTLAEGSDSTYAQLDFDGFDFIDYIANPNMAYLLNSSDTSTPVAYAGSNMLDYAVPYYEEHIAFSNYDSDQFRANVLYIAPYQLRNVEELELNITNRDSGTVYFSKTHSYLRKMIYDTENGWSPNVTYTWDGTDSSGNLLTSGTVATVTLSAVLPYGHTPVEVWSFDVTIDSTQPALKTAYYDSTNKQLIVVASDEQYLQGIYAADLNGNLLSKAALSSKQMGRSFTAVLDLSENTSSAVAVYAMDYATNSIGYKITLANLSAPPAAAKLNFSVPDGVAQPDSLNASWVTLPRAQGEPRFDSYGAEFLGWSTSVVNHSAQCPAYFEAGECYLPGSSHTLYGLYCYEKDGQLRYTTVFSCPHENTELRNALSPNCTESGYSGDVYCLDCGQTVAAGTVLAATGHSYEKTVKAPTCTAGGYTTYTCSVCGHSYKGNYTSAVGHSYAYSNSGAVHTLTCSGCGKSYTEAHSYAEGVCVCGAKEENFLHFKSATVTLESDLSMNFYVEKAALEGFSDPYVTFQKAIYDESGNVSDYEETTVTEYAEKTAADGTECYVFTFTGISAKEMSSEVSVTLSGSYDGAVYSGNAVSYSVKQYAENLLSATEDAALRTLLVDMLNYGAEAQCYFAYNTANLANAGLTEEQKAWASQEELSLMSSLSVNDNEGQSIYFESAALLLEEKVTMHFYLDLDEYTGTMEDLYARVFFENANGDLVEYTIEGTELTELNGDHVLYFDGLNAAQMRSIIGVELYSRQMASCISQTLYYSIETYAHNKLADASLAELVTAMMRYGDSVAAYAAQ